MGVKLGQKWAVKDGNLLASNQVGSRFFNKEFDFSRASNGTYVDRDGLLKTAELYNKVTYSEQIQTAYQATVYNNNTISPNGFQNAALFVENTALNSHGLQQSASIPTNASPVNYTISCYAKAKERSQIQLAFYADGAAYNSVNFDLISGTTTGDLSTHTIEDVGGGWYRCSFTSLVTQSTGGYNLMRWLIHNGSTSYYTGDGISGLYMWGLQVVEGTEPLDYQYTNGLQGLPRISFEDGVGHLLL